MTLLHLLPVTPNETQVLDNVACFLATPSGPSAHTNIQLPLPAVLLALNSLVAIPGNVSDETPSVTPPSATDSEPVGVNRTPSISSAERLFTNYLLRAIDEHTMTN